MLLSSSRNTHVPNPVCEIDVPGFNPGILSLLYPTCETMTAGWLEDFGPAPESTSAHAYMNQGNTYGTA